MARCSGRNVTTARRTLLDYATGVAVDGSGNVVVTGYSYFKQFTGRRLLHGQVCGGGRRAALGKTRQLRRKGASVAVDANGNVVVAASGNDYYTAKYSAADGALVVAGSSEPRLRDRSLPGESVSGLHRAVGGCADELFVGGEQRVVRQRSLVALAMPKSITFGTGTASCIVTRMFDGLMSR